MLSLSDDQFNVNIKSSLLLKLYLPKGVSINQDNFKQRESFLLGKSQKQVLLKKTFLVVFGYLCLPAWHYIPAFLRYNQHWRCSQQTNKTIFSPFFASVQVQRRTTTTTENFFLQVFVFTSLQSNLSLLSSDIFFFQIFFRLLHLTKPLS